MLKHIFGKVFGSRNDKYLRQMRRYLPQIQSIYQSLATLSDDELLQKSTALKSFYAEHIAKETKNDRIAVEREKLLKKMLPEAFALLKEALRREFDIELYDVQLIGGMVLHFGNIAEMKTGEGKTYTALLPAYLNALTGRSVHVVTVNDYLANRDAEKVKPVLARLGVSVASNVKPSEMSVSEKVAYLQAQYSCDVVYGTSNNFGFDFLHDNLETDMHSRVMKDRFYAIVDEVDSVLIDEARTPLIISKQSDLKDDNKELLYLARDIVRQLVVGDIIEKGATDFEKRNKRNEEVGDFKLDLIRQRVIFTESGMDRIAEMLIKSGVIENEEELYSPKNIQLNQLIQVAAEAEYARVKNKDYIVKDDEIIIIDPMTGRLQPGRSWGGGLHQAIEAKEGVKLTPLNETSATITLQHYFRKYAKLSGMTGTADTEALEFYQVYNLETFVIPTNKPPRRIDRIDSMFGHTKDRDALFLKIVQENHEKGRPILIGTNSVKENERYSALLTQHGILHETLNAKNHAREAEIIAKAGELGSITLATNMAGRGTDIILGGSRDKEIEKIQQDLYHRPEYKVYKAKEIEEKLKQNKQTVIELGGLLVISLGKNESRRVDNQLRGRSGRQGDVGESIFLVSLEDEIFIPFGDRVKAIQNQLGDMQVNSTFLNKSITSLQKKMENNSYEGRKYVMEFSYAGDKQTDVIYEYRDSILENEDWSSFVEQIKEMLKYEVRLKLDNYIPIHSFEEQWDLKGVQQYIDFNHIDFNAESYFKANENIDTEEFKDVIQSHFEGIFERVLFLSDTETIGREIKRTMLDTLDSLWVEHLTNLEQMKKGIHLRGYAQKNPKEEYKKEAFEMFERLLFSIRAEIIQSVLNLQHLTFVQDKSVGEDVEFDFSEHAQSTAEAI